MKGVTVHTILLLDIESEADLFLTFVFPNSMSLCQSGYHYLNMYDSTSTIYIHVPILQQYTFMYNIIDNAFWFVKSRHSVKYEWNKCKQGEEI